LRDGTPIVLFRRNPLSYSDNFGAQQFQAPTGIHRETRRFELSWNSGYNYRLRKRESWIIGVISH
jgi:hypothetical protein